MDILKYNKQNDRDMMRTHFYYTTKKHPDVEMLYAVKNCIRPRATKVWRELNKALDKGILHRISWSRNPTQNLKQ